jgi:hypothetical protein
LQKSLPAEADGAVHMTPAAKAAAAPPTVALNIFVFMLGFLFSAKTGTPPPLVALAESYGFKEKVADVICVRQGTFQRLNTRMCA